MNEDLKKELKEMGLATGAIWLGIVAIFIFLFWPMIGASLGFWGWSRIGWMVIWTGTWIAAIIGGFTWAEENLKKKSYE